jgi:hypothetical protein
VKKREAKELDEEAKELDEEAKEEEKEEKRAFEPAHFQGMLALIDEQLLVDELEKSKPKAKRKYKTKPCPHGHQKSQCTECATGRCEHVRSKSNKSKYKQGLRHRPLPARAPEEPVQRLQPAVLLPARAPQELVQGLQKQEIYNSQ